MSDPLDEALAEEARKRERGRMHDAQMGSRPLPVKPEKQRVPPPVEANVYRSIKRFT